MSQTRPVLSAWQQFYTREFFCVDLIKSTGTCIAIGFRLFGPLQNTAVYQAAIGQPAFLDGRGGRTALPLFDVQWHTTQMGLPLAYKTGTGGAALFIEYLGNLIGLTAGTPT
ncbi:hypothetical protein AL051_17250 [Pseudomonas amygdali pv. dendropanacis]|nr:hypothetical protein AL051_17250 [Pseudomonas amygdali pv. dendropanacis]